MKNLLLSIIIFFYFNQLVFSASFQIITTSSLTYSPDILSVHVGDTITINASSFHPLVQVDEAAWDANVATPLAGGWGTKTAPYTFVTTQADTIYFVCGNHVSLGMKGRLVVEESSGVNDLTIEQNDFLISPNPLSSYGVITINNAFRPNFNLKVYDNYGNLARLLNSNNITAVGESQFLLDVTGLSNGIYMIVFSDGKYLLTKKVLIVR